MTTETESVFEEKNKICGGTLYLVSTPIGNLSDLSERGKKVLGGVDFVAAEDTRVTSKLLSAYDLHPSLVSYHEHNKREAGETIVRRLKEGESCALVTDAGTPAVSDPGADLVRLCIEQEIPVTSVPGACAAITALTLSGMETRRFVFEGFLEGTASDKKARLADLAGEKRTMILYEAPHRLKETLSLLCEAFGENRKIALCRELTKRNEEITRLTLHGAVILYETQEPRGEYVLIIEGKGDEKPFWADMTVKEHVAYYQHTMEMDKMAASKAAARDRGVSKSVIYKELLEADKEKEKQ